LEKESRTIKRGAEKKSLRREENPIHDSRTGEEGGKKPPGWNGSKENAKRKKGGSIGPNDGEGTPKKWMETWQKPGGVREVRIRKNRRGRGSSARGTKSPSRSPCGCQFRGKKKKTKEAFKIMLRGKKSH